MFGQRYTSDGTPAGISAGYGQSTGTGVLEGECFAAVLSAQSWLTTTSFTLADIDNPHGWTVTSTSFTIPTAGTYMFSCALGHEPLANGTQWSASNVCQLRIVSGSDTITKDFVRAQPILDGVTQWGISVFYLFRPVYLPVGSVVDVRFTYAGGASPGELVSGQLSLLGPIGVQA